MVLDARNQAHHCLYDRELDSLSDAAKSRTETEKQPLGKPNPIHRRSASEDQGTRRNLWCPLYFECLDVATVNWWRDFSCEKCANRRITDKPRADEISNSDVVGWEDIWRSGHIGD
jgi:hypothetical protein